jgi:hypothetical protein
MSKQNAMTDRSKVIFGNPMEKKIVKKAEKSKKKYIKKFGDDSNTTYPLAIEDNKELGELLGIKNIVISTDTERSNSESQESFDVNKGIIVGNIRMGFGHYRISMAIASAAHHLGYVPYWMDLNSFTNTTCGKVIQAQNNLYSLGSRISQKSRLFNHFVWEPVNYEGFKKISYNAADQKNAELMATVYREVPKEIPVVATHVWPAQAAVHAGMKYVVNAIPDNWPMALHLAEGSVHTVQTHSALLGYRMLYGMNKKKILNPMPAEDICYTGHYIDHELVANIEADCEARIQRGKNKKAVRFLLTIGGAGAQREIFAEIIKYLIPHIKAGRAVLYVNVGDYKNVWEELTNEIPQLSDMSVAHFNQWSETEKLANDALNPEVEIKGIHAFYHENIFEAVYCTNLLMRSSDVLVTKPSELAFYPVPKLFIKRVGGHERWGAIHSAEIGDGTMECDDIAHTLQMVKMMISDRGIIEQMCHSIVANKQLGIYDGAYKAVELAMNLRKS